MASSDILVFLKSKRKAAHFSSVSQKKIFQFFFSFVDFFLVFWRQKSTIYFIFFYFFFWLVVAAPLERR